MTMLFQHIHPLFCLWKLSPPACQGGGQSAFGQMSATLPHSQLPASKMRQTFLSTNLACLLAFEQQAAGSHIYTVSATNRKKGIVRRWWIWGCVVFTVPVKHFRRETCSLYFRQEVGDGNNTGESSKQSGAGWKDSQRKGSRVGK